MTTYLGNEMDEIMEDPKLKDSSKKKSSDAVVSAGVAKVIFWETENPSSHQSGLFERNSFFDFDKPIADAQNLLTRYFGLVNDTFDDHGL